MEDGARARDEVREEYVPLLCAFVFGGMGDGDGPERRARLLLWKDEGARDGIDGMWSRGEAIVRYRLLASRAWHDVIHAIVEKEKNVGRTWYGERGLFGIGRSDINVLGLALPLGSL